MSNSDQHVAAIRISSAPSQSTEFLREIQRAILTHPLAAQAAMRFLIREGREFQKSPDGKARARALSMSPLVQRARIAWETNGGWLLDEQPEGALPSNFLDALLDMSATGRVAARDVGSKHDR